MVTMLAMQADKKEKTCSKCGQTLPIEMFVKSANKPDGRHSHCKPCNRIRLKAFRDSNLDHCRDYARRWIKKNPEAHRARTRRWAQSVRAKNQTELPPIPEAKTCPGCGITKHGSEFFACKSTLDGRVTYCKACSSQQQKDWRKNNPDAAALKDKHRWSKLTPEEQSEMTARAVKWHQDHIEERRSQRMVHHKRRIKDDPQYYWQHRIRNAVLLGLRCIRKSAPTETLVGCSFLDLRNHLEAQFEPWMNWKNYGRSEGCWSIDHKVPVSAFDLQDPVQQRLCFHYSNQRPMRHVDNRKKAYIYDPADMDVLRKRVLGETN